MTRVVLVMHDPLASAFAACARHVLGAVSPQLFLFDVKPDADVAGLEAQVLACIVQPPAQGCLVLCDLYGSTPFNVAQRAVARARGQAVLVSGANLNMLLKALTDTHSDPQQLGEHVFRSGLRGIICPSEGGAC